jgi:transcriptional regulator with XRE-family HTH domain
MHHFCLLFMPRTSSRRRHTLAAIREILQLSQTELGLLVGAAQRTIQAVELQVRPLSSRLAHRLSEEIGIPARTLLANAENLPDPAVIRKQFEQAQTGRFKGRYLLHHVTPRLFLFRFYAVMRVIVDELGFDGCRAIGFFDAFSKLETKLLVSIPAKRLRGQLDQGVRDARKASNEQVMNLLASDVQEARQELRKYKPPNATKSTTLHKQKGSRNPTSA